METGSWNEYLKFFAALLAIVNPVGAIPIFINLTEEQRDEERRKTGTMAAVSVAVILAVVLFSGESVLDFFGVTVGSFRVGGGILILLMAISMLHAKVSQVKQTEEEMFADRETGGVVPLGTPLLAGPGAISTVILYAQRYSSTLHYVILLAGIVLLALLTWLCFRMAPVMAKVLGKTGINVFTRIMGLFMAAIGVEFIANGLKQLFPLLAG
ncbi:MAG: YchE family NAAT transporter [Proteobacteria bacterium]|nr:YchE family NAAT transporter [Pseudomonadota bacterium]MBU4295362.1 YchE family NAAT transporter [Pseudomonadota bacterium]MCG2749382.1 YchE family NAAT transporter [Desulfobulbaceae bacterium]